MNKYWTLTRVLFKNGAMPGQAGSRRGKLALLIVAAAFLPMLFMEAFGLWKAYDVIAAMKLTGAVTAGLLTAACLAMVVFGILYVISTYYFADDTVLLLTMPIPPHRILAAKFTVVLLFQYTLELLIALPGLIVFGVRGGTVFYWLNAFIVFAALPLLPTVVCSVISILVMASSRVFHNKDRVKLLGGLLAVVLAVGISAGMQLLGNRTFSAGALQKSSGLMDKTAVLFPSNLLAARAVCDGTVRSLLWLAAFLLVSAAAVAVFLWLGNRLYLSGVVGLTQAERHHGSKQAEARAIRRPAALAIALKDWRLLVRTPAFALNCVLGAFLVPLILVGSFAFTLRGVTFPGASPVMIAVGVLFLNFVSMMNMASPTAISRDGRDAVVSRYVPVPPEAQMIGKLLPGLGLSLAALLLTAAPVCILFRPGLSLALPVCGLSVVSVVTFNMVGLLVDCAFPKLDWDDETIAVKRNFNVAIEMLLMIVLLALPAFLVYKLRLGLREGELFLTVYSFALLAVSAWLLFRKGFALYAGETRARPTGSAGRQRVVRMAAGAAVTLAVLGWIGWETFFVHTEVRISASQVTVTAGLGESTSFSLSRIQSVYLKDALPPVSGRVGFASGAQMRGSFNVEGLGRGHVYTQSAKGPFLFVLFKGGGFTVFNFTDAQKTRNLYDRFRPYAVS